MLHAFSPSAATFLKCKVSPRFVTKLKKKGPALLRSAEQKGIYFKCESSRPIIYPDIDKKVPKFMVQDASFNSNILVASTYLNHTLQAFLDELKKENNWKERQLLVTEMFSRYKLKSQN